MRSLVIVFALLLAPLPAFALDASSAQQNCQDVRDAAEAARVRAIKAAIPRKDPVEVFQQSTEACLKGIISYSKFEFKLPSLADLQAMLQQMAQELIARACQSATDQFNRAVQDATAQLDLGQTSVFLPGYGDIGLVNTGTGSVSAGSNGITTSGSPVTATTPTSQGVVSNVINWVTGKDKGGEKDGDKP